ncbi:tRNA pseudouridine(55) synthase TruB [Leptolyngbya sp. NIES-2104]|uniref:tRNA pseudouridine(55) synthase TruB n=1 Tax=Leptolyngbya sp. NIES-2104 TaxID=1552121 RepID=UPI0006EC666B|nr:tRNA pseudouridine(55) synthase TruB [Leptolyngbya sp. NIES-2104]GAP94382.1 tRNA pseudouridine synthase B [Leptolyngbya sp. NIES-2104]
MDGFLNLNKPFGFTSHDCVAKVRRIYQLKKVGHAGTLDPAATGVLPIAIGRATRLLQYLRHEKAYQATIRFGVTTATDDLEGEVLTQQAVPNLELSQIEEKLPLFQGVIQQIPPNYSAIQVQGKRLYELARSGQAIEAPIRTVEILDLKILAFRPGDFPELDLEIACGGGTYIRSIARDLGAELGTGATLAKLLRTESSGFELAGSSSIEQLPVPLMEPESALLHLPEMVLTSDLARRWCQGQKIAIESERSGMVRVKNDSFLGIGEVRSDGVLVPQMVYEPV